MPILLIQPHPYRRSLIFLAGSFTSLMVMGLLFAHGFGRIIFNFEKTHSWLLPTVEAAAGITLLCIAATIGWRNRTGELSVEPSAAIIKRLKLSNWQLFLVGTLLVVVQSIIDVVFVLAMIRLGQLNVSASTLIAAVATYAVFALVLQLLVVLAYRLSPLKKRARTLDQVHWLLTKYTYQMLIGVSCLLSAILLGLAIFRH